MDCDQFTDAVGLVNDHEKIYYGYRELEAVTKKLIRLPHLLEDLRPIHFSLREFVVDSQSELPLDLQSMLPDSETANARLAIECLRHLLAGPDMSARYWLGYILPYCGRYFDTHIRRLATIPEEIFEMLDRIIFSTDKHIFLKILTWRWPVPTSEDLDQADITCLGSPQSIDPMFFLRCTKLDQIPTIRARYATVERIDSYPDSYLHIAAITGLDDVVGELIERGVDPNQEDAGHFTALQVLCSITTDETEVFETIIMMLLEAGADPDKATASADSPYKCAQGVGMEKFVKILNKFKGVEKVEAQETGISGKWPYLSSFQA